MELYIDGQIADIYDDLTYSIDIAIADFNDITKRDSIKSLPIKVPATARNRALLDFPENNCVIKSIAKTGILKSYSFEFKGEILFIESNTINEITEYELMLVGNNFGFINAITEKLCSEINMTVLDHEYTATDIKAITGTLAVPGTGVNLLYPIVNMGDFGGADIKVTHRYPAFNLLYLFDQIVSAAGYSWSCATSTLLNFIGQLFYFDPKDFCYTDDYVQSKLALVAPAGDLNYPASGIAAIVPFDNENIYPYYDNGNNWDILNNRYVAPVTGYYTFDLTIYNTNDGALGDSVLLLINKNGSTINSTAIVNTAIGSGSATLTTGAILLAATDYIDVYITTGSLTVVILDDSSLKVIFDNVIRIGADVFANQLLKSTKQTTIIDILKKLCNLYFIENVNEKILYFDSFDNFYASSQDWTSKIDYKKEIKVYNQKENTSYIFGYSNDTGDKAIDEYEKNQNASLKLGEYRQVNDSISKQTEVNITVDASATAVLPAPQINLTNTNIPKMWSEVPPTGQPDWSNSISARILYYNNLQYLSPGDSYTFEGTGFIDYPKFLFQDANAIQKQLSFTDKNSTDGLFTSFYSNYFRLKNPVISTKEFYTSIELYLNLTNKDVINIINCTTGKDLRTKIYLSDSRYKGYYFIDKIFAFNPETNGSTKVKLIKFI